MKYPSVVDVRSQQDYTLHITFDNGETGLLDMKPYLDFGIFSRIKDPHSFAKVRVSFDTVEWESGADLDPEFVYRKCKKNTPESLDIITLLNQPKNMPELNFTKSKDGLLPAIAQDAASGDVLMLAYINEESWQKTLETGKAHYWSRSRNKLWLKGESSGHVQMVKEILVDCDQDTVVFKVEQLGGAACHKGYASCFFRRVKGDELEIIAEPIFDPAKVYG